MTGSLGKMPWRMLGWGTAILLLAAPFVAMRFTSEVNWSLGDFIFAGVLFALIGGALELAVRASSNHSYRIAAGLALLGALLVVWVDLAVGIVGSERNPANRDDNDRQVANRSADDLADKRGQSGRPSQSRDERKG